MCFFRHRHLFLLTQQLIFLERLNRVLPKTLPTFPPLTYPPSTLCVCQPCTFPPPPAAFQRWRWWIWTPLSPRLWLRALRWPWLGRSKESSVASTQSRWGRSVLVAGHVLLFQCHLSWSGVAILPPPVCREWPPGHLSVDWIANADLFLCHTQGSAVKACSHVRKTEKSTRNKVID